MRVGDIFHRRSKLQLEAWTALAGFLLLASVSCGPGETPTPTFTLVPLQEPTFTHSPTSTHTAVPTPTPTTRAPTPTEPAGDPGPSRLFLTLQMLPLSFRDRGVWFHHLGRALEMADVPQPRSFEEFMALDEAELDAYNEAFQGISVSLGSIFSTLTYQAQDWKKIFGFDAFNVDLGVRTGETSSISRVLNYFGGDLDPAVIRRRLMDLGYMEQQSSGLTYYTVREDCGGGVVSLQDSVGRLTLGSMNCVFIGPGVLIAAPNTNLMISILETRAGAMPSLAEDHAFSSLAKVLGDTLWAGLLTRQATLNPTVRGVTDWLMGYEPPATWGTLHEWEALGFGYGVASEGPWWDISLFYSDSQAAEADAPELLQRMERYTTAAPAEIVERGHSEKPLDKACRALSSSYQSDDKGSTLTVRCHLKEKSLVGEVLILVDARDLGFLLP